MRSLGALAIAAIVLLAGGGDAFADETLAAIAAGECTLSLEASLKWQTLRLRARHPRHHGCLISEDDVRRVMAEAAAAAHPAWEAGPFSSLSLGRLIEYPFWARQLAARAAADTAGWDLRRGRPVDNAINAYAAKQLRAAEGIRVFETSLAEAGYRIAGVSVEKVLVGPYPQAEGSRPAGRKGQAPFDAQVWLRLERRR
jgi:hypothetical protein